MTLNEYMATGGEVVTDKIAAYVEKEVFNNLLKMSYGSLELLPPSEMVTTYTDTVLAINKYKYDTLLASATAEMQSGARLNTKQTHSGNDTLSTDTTNTTNQSGTTSDTTTNNTTNISATETSGENTTTYGHIIDSEKSDTGKTADTSTQTVENSGTNKTADTSTQTVENSGTNKTADTSTQTVKNTGTQSNSETGSTSNSVAAYDVETFSAKDKQDNTSNGTRTDDLTATTTNGGEINVTTSGTATTTNGGEINVTTSETATTTNGGEINVTNSGTAKDTHSGSDVLASSANSSTNASSESTTTSSGENSTTATNTVNGLNTTAYGHIIETEQSTEYNSPDYIAAMRSAAMFSLAKIIAVDITAAICIGVW